MYKRQALALTALPFIASASSAVAFEKGDILVRGGFATVAPDESSSNINVGDDLGFGLTIDNNTQLGLTAAYFITDRVNVEVLAATPFTHDVNFARLPVLGNRLILRVPQSLRQFGAW